MKRQLANFLLSGTQWNLSAMVLAFAMSLSFATVVIAQPVVDPQQTQIFTYGNDDLDPQINNSTDFCPAINFVVENPIYSSCVDFSPSLNLNWGEFDLLLVLDFGEDYNLGDNPVSASLELEVSLANSGCNVIPVLNPWPETTWQGLLEIDENVPEQHLLIDNVTLTDDIRNIQVNVINYSVTGGQPAEDAVRFRLEYRPKVLIKPTTAPTALSASPLSGDVWEFSWSNACNIGMPGHEVQVLRLANHSDPDVNYSGSAVSAHVDWSKALTVPLNGPQNSVKLTIAEGSGYYAWRVRAIGNTSGDFASATDWGPWSDHGSIQDGQQVSISSASSTYLFEHTQIDEDRNWIYSRSFVEGDGVNVPIRIGENMTFANGLNQSQQQQSHLFGQDQIIVTQTLPDLTGSPSLTTLPVPLASQTHLGYKEEFLRTTAGVLLRAEDYDLNGVNNPPQVMLDDNVYYESNVDLTIPFTQGYPFQRTINYPDGSGRPMRQSGPGEIHRLRTQEDRTVHINYANVTDGELVRVFGDEAPSQESVYKVITSDPNGSASVQYVDMTGKTIATCLSASGENPKLLSLDTNPGEADYTVTAAIENLGYQGSFARMGTQTLVLTQPTEVTFDFSLTPHVVEASCDALGVCKTCDHVVEVLLVSVSDPSDVINVLLEDVSGSQGLNEDRLDNIPTPLPGPSDLAGPMDCPVGQSPIPLSVTIPDVPAGGYAVTLVIRSANSADYLGELETSNLLQEHLLDLRNKYDEVFSDYLNNSTLFQMLTPVPPALPDVQLFYAELEASGATQNLTPEGDLVSYSLYIEPLCMEIEVPYIPCESILSTPDGDRTCDAGATNGLGFIDYFVNYWENDDEYNVPSIYLHPLEPIADLGFYPFLNSNYLNMYFGPPGSTLPPGLGQQSFGDFDQVLANLAADMDPADCPNGDCCERIWECWMAVTSSYGGLLFIDEPTDPDYEVDLEEAASEIEMPDGVDNPMNNDQRQPDIPRMFFECIGWQYSDDPNDQVVTDDPVQYAERPYKYIFYEFDDQDYTYNPCVDQMIETSSGQCADPSSVPPVPLSAPLLSPPGDVYDWEVCLTNDPYDPNNYNNIEGFEQPIGTTVANESYTVGDAWATFKSCLESEPDLGFQWHVDNPASEEDALEAATENLNTNCAEVCEDRRSSFELAIIDAYHEQGIYVSTDEYHIIDSEYPEENETWAGEGWGGAEPPSYEIDTDSPLPNNWMTSGLYQFVPMSQVNCMVQSLIDNCTGSCTFEYDEALFLQDPSQTLRQQFHDQLAELQQAAQFAFTAPFEIALTGADGFCPTIDSEDPVQRDFTTINAASATSTEMQFTGDDRAYRSTSMDFAADGVSLDGYLYLAGTVIELAQTGLEYVAPTWASNNIKKDEGNIWVVKVDPSDLSIVNQWVYGGRSDDLYAYRDGVDLATKILTDGTLLYVVSTTESTNLNDNYCNPVTPSCDCEVSGPDSQDRGSSDIWVFSINQQGEIQKARTYGGTGQEIASDASISNGELVVLGLSSSVVDGVSNMFSDAGVEPGHAPPAHVWSFGISLDPASNWDIVWDHAINEYTEVGPLLDPTTWVPSALHLEPNSTGGNTVLFYAFNSGDDPNTVNPDYPGNSNNPHLGVNYAVIYKFETNNMPPAAYGTNNYNHPSLVTQKIGDFPFVYTISDIHSHPDGGYLLLGYTMAPANWSADDYRIDGVLSGGGGTSYFNSDLWLLKINDDLSYGWDKCYGSKAAEGGYLPYYINNNNPTTSDEYLVFLEAFLTPSSTARIYESNIGEYVLVGTAQKTDQSTLALGGVRTDPGPVGAPLGSLDYWAVLTDDDGNYISDLAIGGNTRSPSVSPSDKAAAVIGIDNETIAILGTSASDVGADRSWEVGGKMDMWLTTVDLGRCTHPDFCFRWLDFPVIDGPNLEPETCEETTAESILNSIYSQSQIGAEEAVADFRDTYMDQCVENLDYNFTYSYDLGYHHYTLYYHDRAGNLIKTVPPAGVDHTSTTRDDHPNHKMVTDYQTNSLGQPVRQNTPDGGNTQFWHNALGQMRFSQNAQQVIDGEFAYTKYDNLGRVVEVGKSSTTGIPSNFWEDPDYVDNQNFPSTNTSERTFTYYSIEVAPSSFPEPYDQSQFAQRYVQNRVSYTRSEHPLGAPNPDKYTYFSYDPHGNVEWLIQEIPGLDGAKLIKYRYDLYSGNVLQVDYQPDLDDQFYHRYTYDADGRIEQVETSRDGVMWDRDARYEYYAHGPLRRTLIGEDKVQGIDNVYTLQGWLKSLNHPTLDNALDPGSDGDHAQNNVARDAFGMSLYYHDGDFHHAGSPFDDTDPMAMVLDDQNTERSLYNGNIAGWVSNMDVPSGETWDGPQAWNYRYDVLNRIKTADFSTFSGGQWNATTDHATEYNYDANGNITHLKRNGNAALGMDDLTYEYSTTGQNNRLQSVEDPTPELNFDVDIDGTRDFTYDENGNLITDLDALGEGISGIDWNLQGKIASIDKTDGERLEFEYDAMGNRVIKRVIPAGDVVEETYYVRDAQGNLMATYGREFEPCGIDVQETITLKERPIYGSSRLGLDQKEVVMLETVCSNNTPQVWVGSMDRIPEQNVMTITGATQYFTWSIPALNLNIQIPYTAIHRYDVSSATPQLLSSINFWAIGSATSVTAEDASGNLVFTGLTTSTSGFPSLLLYDASNSLVLGTQTITQAAPGTPALAIEWDNQRWLLFTINAQGKVYYHVINKTPNLEVIAADIPLTQDDGYAFNMALIADHAGVFNSRLFLKKRGDRNTLDQLVSIGMSPGLALPAQNQIPDLETELTAYGDRSSGEIQISPDGMQLALVDRTESTTTTIQSGGLSGWLGGLFGPITISTLPKPVIRVFDLSADHRVTLGVNPVWADEHILSGWGVGVRSFDFSPTGESIYYAEVAGRRFQTTKIKRWEMAPDNVTDIYSDYASSIRRADNGHMHALANPDFIAIDNPDGTPSAQVIAVGTNGVGGFIRLQPHRIYPSEVDDPPGRLLGLKRYELNDHLGNIRAVVSDRKLSTLVSGVPQGFRADISSLSNYYPFGMQMVGRNFTSSGYRFGFNGREKDDEVSSSANHISYSERGYDTRLGRWWSVDGQAIRYPGLSTYSFTGLNPIAAFEVDGDWFETGWDLANVGIGVVSFGANIAAGNYLDAGLDALGLVYDGVATAVPVLPAGAGTALKVSRLGQVAYKGVSYAVKVGTALRNSSALRTALNITDKLMEAHHIIPKSLLKNSKVVQDAVEAGFDFNGVQNGIAVKKFTKAGDAAGDLGQHANHPSYTKKVQAQLDDWTTANPDYTPDQARGFLESLSNDLKDVIKKESVEGGKKVNDLDF